MKCPYCGKNAEPPKCTNCYAEIHAEKPKTVTPEKIVTKPKKEGK